MYVFFYSRTVHLDIKVFYLPTDAEENCFKKNIKIYIKTAPICFGAITSSGSALFELAKVIALANTNNALPDYGDCTEICRSYVFRRPTNAVLSSLYLFYCQVPLHVSGVSHTHR